MHNGGDGSRRGRRGVGYLTCSIRVVLTWRNAMWNLWMSG